MKTYKKYKDTIKSFAKLNKTSGKSYKKDLAAAIAAASDCDSNGVIYEGQEDMFEVYATIENRDGIRDTGLNGYHMLSTGCVMYPHQKMHASINDLKGFNQYNLVQMCRLDSSGKLAKRLLKEGFLLSVCGPADDEFGDATGILNLNVKEMTANKKRLNAYREHRFPKWAISYNMKPVFTKMETMYLQVRRHIWRHVNNPELFKSGIELIKEINAKCGIYTILDMHSGIIDLDIYVSYQGELQGYAKKLNAMRSKILESDGESIVDEELLSVDGFTHCMDVETINNRYSTTSEIASSDVEVFFSDTWETLSATLNVGRYISSDGRDTIAIEPNPEGRARESNYVSHTMSKIIRGVAIDRVLTELRYAICIADIGDAIEEAGFKLHMPGDVRSLYNNPEMSCFIDMSNLDRSDVINKDGLMASIHIKYVGIYDFLSVLVSIGVPGYQTLSNKLAKLRKETCFCNIIDNNRYARYHIPYFMEYKFIAGLIDIVWEYFSINSAERHYLDDDDFTVDETFDQIGIYCCGSDGLNSTRIIKGLMRSIIENYR